MALAVALAAALPGCRQSHAPKQVAEFEGFADPSTGQLTIRMIQPDGMARLAALTEIPVDSSGGPGAGAFDHVELVTEWASYTDALGNPTGISCGRAGTFCGMVTVRSFFAGDELHNVYVQIMNLAPTVGNVGIGNTHVPTAGQPGVGEVDATNGLWAYPALLDTTRGVTGANAASRIWYFDNVNNTPFTFHGRVMADQVARSGLTGFETSCGGTPTDITTSSTNCGECNRGIDGTCSFALAGSGITSRRVFSGCAAGQTACDSANAMAVNCVDTQTNVNNCGVCGQICTGGTTCVAGKCQLEGATCAAGQTLCGAACCPAGSTCVTGNCVLTDATAISVGRDHACATTTSARAPSPSAQVSSPNPLHTNNVLCWGSHFYAAQTSPLAVAVPEFNDTDLYLRPTMWKLSSGDDQSVALIQGFVDPGNPQHTSSWRWGSVSNYVDGWLSAATDIVTGGHHICGNFGYGIWCNGPTNALGQMGNAQGPNCDGTNWTNCKVSDLSGNPWGFASGLTAKQFSAGGDTTCAVLRAPDDPVGIGAGAGQTEDDVACWGDNASSKAGQATGAFFTTPVVVAGVSLASSVSVGGRHAVALLQDGTLAFWGRNLEGQFGNGSNASTPGAVVPFDPGRTVDSISAGQDFTCYVSNGSVYCAGANNRGQLGDGSTTNRNTFVQVKGVTGALAVSAGGVPGSGNTALGSACALATGNTVYCWGDNTANQLGYGVSGASAGYSTTPKLVQLATVSVQ